MRVRKVKDGVLLEGEDVKVLFDRMGADRFEELAELLLEVDEEEDGRWQPFTLQEVFYPAGGSDIEPGRVVKFVGQKLITHRFCYGEHGDGDDRGERWDVYQTKGGKYVVSLYRWSHWRDEPSSTTVEVFEELAELEEHLPRAVLDKLRAMLGSNIEVVE